MSWPPPSSSLQIDDSMAQCKEQSVQGEMRSFPVTGFSQCIFVVVTDILGRPVGPFFKG